MSSTATSTGSLPDRRRSFTGCLQCKGRRIKCDEKRPACGQCVKKGCACSGSTSRRSIRWSQKHETLCRSPGPVLDTDVATAPNPPTWSSTGLSSQPALSPESTNTHVSCSIELQEPSERRCFVIPECDFLQILTNDATPAAENNSMPTPDSIDQAVEVGRENGNDGVDVFQDGVQDVAGTNWDMPVGAQGVFVFNRSSKLTMTKLSSESTHLIQHYFRRVCPIYSTFDSELNPFRSFVSDKWQTSAPIFYAAQSMAAAHLANTVPAFRRFSQTYHSLAWDVVQKAIPAAGTTNQISMDVLFALLLLGPSACWHNRKSWGLSQLKALQDAVYGDHLADDAATPQTHDFLVKALIYWEMVASVVDYTVLLDEYSSKRDAFRRKLSQSPRPIAFASQRISPHPWTGVSCLAQMIFGQITKNIQLCRQRHDTLDQSDIARMSKALEDIENLEMDLWNFQLPLARDVDSFDDSNTPGLHHVLIAHSYALVCLYQIYQVFPKVLQKRREMVELNILTPGCSLGLPQQPNWLSFINEDMLHLANLDWTDRIGQQAAFCLQQISDNSHTFCVQLLPLMVSASSLRIVSDNLENGYPAMIREARHTFIQRVRNARGTSPRIQLACCNVFLDEIFRQLDCGNRVYWLDLLQSLRIMTIFG